MGKLDEGFRSIGLRLPKDQWYGPGAAASAWLRQVGAPKRQDLEKEYVMPLLVHVAAKAAYYGGWFEIAMHGKIPGVAYEYDINSAYPSITAALPCLLHGTWKRSKSKTFPRLRP